jgi:hypothetical protein
MAQVFKTQFTKGSLLESSGLVATNNGTTLFGRTKYGHVIRLNGSSQWISYAGSVTVKTAIIFLKPNALSSDIIDFDGGTHSIEVGAANVTATGFDTPSITVNGAASAALSIGAWQMISVTTATGFTANAIKIGKETSYFNGDVAYVYFDSAQLSALDIQKQYIDCLALTMISPPIRGFTQTKPSDLSRYKSSGLVFAMNGTLTNDRKVIDLSGSGNNGTAQGNVVNTLEGLQFATGKVTFPSSASFNIGTGNVSFKMRIKFYSISQQSIISQYDGDGILMRIDAGGHPFIELIDNTTSRVCTSNVVLVANKTYTIVFTCDRTSATGMKWFIDGAETGYSRQDNISTLTGAINPSSVRYMGIEYDNTSYKLNGEIQDFQQWSKSVTLQEIKDYHNSFCRTPYLNESFKGDAVGSHPMNFTRGSGQYSVQELSADIVSGNLRMPKGTRFTRCDGAGTRSLQSNQSSGVWRFKWKKGADGNNFDVYFITNKQSVSGYGSNVGYRHTVYNNERIYFDIDRGTAGSYSDLFYSALSYITINTWYETEIRRTPAGQFTVLIRGGNFTPTAGYGIWTLVSTTSGSGTNPVTDATYNSSSYFVLDLDALDCVADIYLQPYIPV